MSIIVYVNDTPRRSDLCHSQIVTEDRDDAIALLWFLAKQTTPEFGCFFEGYEWQGNWHMRTMLIPETVSVKHWGEVLEETIESIVVEALNEVYDELGRKYGDLRPREFVDQVALAAREWAHSCFPAREDR